MYLVPTFSSGLHLIKKASMKLDGRFLKKVRGQIQGYEFEVGVLKDTAHKRPVPGIKPLAGGPARRTGGSTGVSVAQVSEHARKTTGINFYTRPFKDKGNKELIRFANAYIKALVSEKGINANKRRVENLLQAIVRNPITRGDYGGNKAAWALKKGFSRLLVDTGQLFKAIVASVRKK